MANIIRGLLLLACLLPRAGFGAGWTEDYKAAQQEARAAGKFLLLDFTGSDWCGWCKRLDAEVFSKKAFKEYAAKNFVGVTIDFPHGRSLPASRKRTNEELAGKYEVMGFPTIILLAPDETVVGRTGYQFGGPEAYVQHLEAMIAPHRAALKPEKPKSPAAVAAVVDRSQVRTWNSLAGQTMQARYDQRVGNVVKLVQTNGKMVMISFESLSEEDRDYLRSINAF